MMKTKKKMPFLYSVGRKLLGGFFLRHYKPEIKGLENVPLEGNIIFAGNHIHLYDQCVNVIKYPRFITYMAKKEYFDSWKTRWFFKSCGCISVDRSKKDNESVKKAIDVLNNGECLGIFPEGTRNALKDKDIKYFHDLYFKNEDLHDFGVKLYNSDPLVSQLNYLDELYKNNKISINDVIDNFFDVDKYLKKLLKNKKISENDYINSLFLEFKYGTVSMAKKTNSVIVPIVITGKYYKHSKFKVNYGKAIKPVDDLEEANLKLRKAFIKLAKENLSSELDRK